MKKVDRKGKQYIAIGIRIPPELHEIVIKAADKEDRSVNNYIKRIIEGHFRDKEGTIGKIK